MNTTSMIDSNTRMIQKQAEVISNLRKEIKELNTRLDSKQILIEQFKDAGCFYLSMQEQIRESEFLQDAWRDFIFALKMASNAEYINNPKEYFAK